MSLKIDFTHTDGFTTDYTGGSVSWIELNTIGGAEIESVEVWGRDYSQGGKLVEKTYTPTTDSVNFDSGNTYFIFDVSQFTRATGFGGTSVEMDVVIASTEPKDDYYVDFDSMDGFTTTYTDEHISILDSVELIADDGLEFVQIIAESRDYSSGGGYFETTYQVDDIDADLFFNEDFTIFNFSIGDYVEKSGLSSGGITLKVITQEKESSGVPYSSRILDIFRITQTQLVEFNNMRWNPDFDFDNLIYSLYSIPIKLDDSVLDPNSKPVKLGNTATGLNARPFIDNKLMIDGGSISVPLLYDNVFDYRGVVCRVHAPYSDPIEIPPEYVIGKDISILYSVDLLNKITMIYISSSVLGGIIGRQEIKFTRDIPYIRNNFNVPNQDVGNFIYNDVMTPYIEVIRDIPINDTNGIYGEQTRQYGRLGDFDGYIEVSDVKLETSSTADEQTRIRQLLNNGIFIK